MTEEIIKNICSIANKIENEAALSEQDRITAASCLRAAEKIMGKNLAKKRGVPRVKIPRDFFMIFRIKFFDDMKKNNISDQQDLIDLRTQLINGCAKKYGVNHQAIRKELKKYGWDFSNGKLFDNTKMYNKAICCDPILDNAQAMEDFNSEQKRVLRNQKDYTLDIAIKLEKDQYLNGLELSWASSALRWISTSLEEGSLTFSITGDGKIPDSFYSEFSARLESGLKNFDAESNQKLRADLVKYYANQYRVTPRAVNKTLKKYEEYLAASDR